MPTGGPTSNDAALSEAVRVAVVALNAAIADAAQAGVEVEVASVDHRSIGSRVKRSILSARLVRPLAD